MRFAVGILTLVLLPAPCAAQLEGWGREQIIKYTSLWTQGRLPDGRPNVSDSLLRRLEGATSEQAWAIREHGYLHQWEGDWNIVNRDKSLVGRAFTVQYMPGRPETSRIIESEARLQGLSQHNVRVMDMLQPGDVVVVDMAGGKIRDGVFMGDNLAAAIMARTGKGMVIYGALRDLNGIEPLSEPVYVKGYWPGVFGDLMLTGVNVPIRVGEVTVLPGDIVLGDKEGVTFIPPHLAEEVATGHELLSLVDEWRKEKFLASKGAIKPSELYGRISLREPMYQQECLAYVKAKLTEQERALSELGSSQGRYCGPTPRTTHPGEMPPREDLYPSVVLEE